MTVQEIYNKIVWFVFGDSTPPGSVSSNLTGINGLIAQAHRDEMSDWNYWFMEVSAQFAFTAATNAYVLPSNFKQEISLSWQDADDASIIHDPLQRLAKGELYTTFQDIDEETDYPTHYSIYGGTGDGILYVWPVNNQDLTMVIQYYKFLDDLAAVGSTDKFTELGAYVLIYKVARDLCINLDYGQKIRLFDGMYKDELSKLRSRDYRKKVGGINGGLHKIDYVGF